MEFPEVYEEFFARIYSYIRCRIGADAAAEDISSAVFQKALARFEQYNPARGNMAQWLFGIARNEVNSCLRKAAILKFFPLDLFGDIFPGESGRDPGTGDTGGDIAELVSALGMLEPRERDMITLKFYSEMTNREIAAVTGLSESNVGTILYRCMAKLRKQLTGENYDAP
ncbi:MAG: sigma-70 family RNA polymerase sigma factor [Elusimicrobiota bacterium]|nr:sigma-70 family RNA polymerase sigma factor [Elusimicrobiota bacterium]